MPRDECVGINFNNNTNIVARSIRGPSEQPIHCDEISVWFPSGRNVEEIEIRSEEMRIYYGIKESKDGRKNESEVDLNQDQIQNGMDWLQKKDHFDELLKHY